MASLWQFFGLPDPEAVPPAKQERPSKPTLGETTPGEPETVQQNLTLPKEPVVTMTNDVPEPVGVQPDRKPVPIGWRGPVTADGEPFHDLGAHGPPPPSIPTRALRYVAPDSMNRLPTRDISKRIQQGDTVVVDLRPLVHMDTHQNVCRRELKQLSDDVGVGVFALDAEDKLLLLPGNNVVVDVTGHELGLTSLLRS